ncbi:hypothetical protein BDZ89DRAFT_1046782 [Hymenopellis radicata]|nr:hypothetical protein BDZ89DRAFT_1046782 [Hymenopellis radicata]
MAAVLTLRRGENSQAVAKPSTSTSKSSMASTDDILRKLNTQERSQTLREELDALRQEDIELTKRLAKRMDELDATLTELKKACQFLVCTNLADHVHKFTIMIAPLHIRVLLDGARTKIVTQSPYSSWEAFRGSRSIAELKTLIVRNINISPDLSSFICEFSDTHTAAHTASIQDVRMAILQEPLGVFRAVIQFRL